MLVSPALRCAIAVALLSTLVGSCAKEAPAPAAPTPMEEAATLGGAEIKVLALESDTPEFVDSSGQAAGVATGPGRVLKIRVSITNTSEAPISYTPQHNVAAGTTAQLFRLPDDGEKTAVPRVSSASGMFGVGQIQSETEVAPGKSIQDEFLFKLAPKEWENLLFVLPGTIFGGDAAEQVRFVLPNKPVAKGEATVATLGSSVQRGAVKVTVTAISDAYVEAEKVAKKPDDKPLKYAYAYTVEPILKIDFDFENTGSEPLFYNPSHRASSPGVELVTVGANVIYLNRFKLADANAAAKGQLRGPIELMPGEKYKDFFLFAGPPSSDAKLALSISGHIFGVKGLFRFELPYTRKEPSAPDLEPYKREAPAAPAEAPAAP